MKRLLFLGLAIVLLLTACQQQEKRYTQQSPEIETYKKIIDAYEKQDWEALASHYADTAKIMNNVLEEEGKTIADEVVAGKEDAALFTSWDYVDTDSEYEMVVTDKGQTWVNFWGTWNGTLAANNKIYTIPAHITAQFINGKVVKEFGYWDISKIMIDVQAMEQVKDTTATATITQQ